MSPKRNNVDMSSRHIAADDMTFRPEQSCDAFPELRPKADLETRADHVPGFIGSRSKA
jgi:hypothetical protein